MFNANCLIRDEAGVTLIEYAMIGCLIAVTCVLMITALGANVSNLYTLVCTAVATATGGGATC